MIFSRAYAHRGPRFIVKQTWCLTSAETIRLIRDGEKGAEGEGGMEVGGGGRLYIYIYIYLSLHRHLQNDSCIKMGSDESQVNVSLIVKD